MRMFRQVKEDIKSVKSEQESLKTKQEITQRGADINIAASIDAELRKKSEDLKKDCVNTCRKSMERDLQQLSEEHQASLKELKEDLQKEKVKVHLIGELLQRNHQVMLDITRRLDNVELSNARKSAVITGIDFSAKKQDRLKQILDFLKEALEVQPNIEDTYLLGGLDPKPVVVIFDTYGDKRIVFQRKAMLKNFEAEGGRSIFINDYVPTATNEKRKRERDLIQDAKEQSISTEYTNKGLKIGEEIYTKKVSAPSPTDILDLDPDDLDRILTLDIDKSDQIRVMDNVFIGYAADTNTHEQVRECYLKVRLLHARARHISCAYMIPGTSHHHQDYEDDEDPGAGRAILQYMRRNNITHKAIYVVRFCGKTKLESNRLKYYSDAAREVITKWPHNSLLKQDQQVSTESEDKKYGRGGKYYDRRRKETDGDVEPKPERRIYKPPKHNPAAQKRKSVTGYAYQRDGRDYGKNSYAGALRS